TAASLLGTMGNPGWYTSAVKVTLGWTDPQNDVTSTSYSVDGGPWHPYGLSPFMVNGEGTHTVSFFSVDAAGNTEVTESTTFKIDATPPKTTWQAFGPDGHFARYSGDVQVVLAASDATSGVAATFYSVDNGAWHNYQGAFMVRGLGQHHVNYYSVDKA